MKRCTLLVLFLGLVASRTAMAQTLCAGAEGSSTACAPACSNTVVNDAVVAGSNAGKFNVGNGNQGDGNDGFNNVGSFNIGSGNAGNCNLASGGNVGSCTMTNAPGQMAVRFCQVYPTDPKCQPGSYLPEFSGDLRNAISAAVASCNGGPPVTPLPPVVEPPTVAQPPMAATPPAVPLTPPGSDEMAALSPGNPFIGVSDSDFNPLTLLTLFAEHLQQDNQAGRKLLLR